MIHYDIIEPTTTQWVKWQKRAAAAVLTLLDKVAKGGAIKISQGLYKNRKEDLMRLFFEKCVYCEVSLKNQHGDIEHYRPKKSVTEIDDSLVTINGTTPPAAHPGYYWLAYTSKNLLPACIICNQQPVKRPDGTLAGKGNRFPITGVRASTHNDNLDAEDALLLHPVLDKPENHLIFNETTGALGFKDSRGEKTIDVLDLNREWLLEQRKKAYNDVLKAYMAAIPYLLRKQKNLADEELKFINQHKTGEAQFAFAGRCAVEWAKRELGSIAS